MNKKITSLSLAGIMLLSTASPVFAEVTEAVKDVKEPNKMEKVLEEGNKKLEETKETGKKAEEKVEEKGKEAVKEIDKEAKEKFEKEHPGQKYIGGADGPTQIYTKTESKDVKATTQKVKLDGKDVVIYGYNIDGYNYFKLRDLAAVLKDTKAKFGVEYKDAMVTLTKGADYKLAETDQKEVKAESKGMLTNDKVMVGDKALTATAYKVDDSNYYKLRDLGEALGFGVDYDKATNTVLLMSEKEAAKEEKVAPKVEEVKASLEKEIAKEKAVRETEEYKKSDVKVQANYDNAIAAAKSIVDDKEAKPEQIENALKALVEAKEQLGFKADVKVEEKKEEVKEVKDEKKDDKKEEVKETK